MLRARSVQSPISRRPFGWPYRPDRASSRRIACGDPCDNAPCVREPPVAGALRRLRRARAASENAAYVHSRPPHWREGR